MVEEQPLRAAQAARRLGIPTKDLLRLVYERKIRYVMVDGIAHFPTDAVEEYRSKAS
jgi:excisionase family DNA binding protein